MFSLCIKINVKFKKILIQSTRRNVRLEESFVKFTWTFYYTECSKNSGVNWAKQSLRDLHVSASFWRKSREKKQKEGFSFFCTPIRVFIYFIIHVINLVASSTVTCTVCLMSILFKILLAYRSSAIQALDRILTTLIAAKHCSVLIFDIPILSIGLLVALWSWLASNELAEQARKRKRVSLPFLFQRFSLK